MKNRESTPLQRDRLAAVSEALGTPHVVSIKIRSLMQPDGTPPFTLYPSLDPVVGADQARGRNFVDSWGTEIRLHDQTRAYFLYHETGPEVVFWLASLDWQAITNTIVAGAQLSGQILTEVTTIAGAAKSVSEVIKKMLDVYADQHKKYIERYSGSGQSQTATVDLEIRTSDGSAPLATIPLSTTKQLRDQIVDKQLSLFLVEK